MANDTTRNDQKLTPLTAPSVRGVLVDDGEPRHLGYGDLYLSDGNLVAWDDVEYASAEKYQPVKLRPASEFGVDARGEPGLKPLPDGAHVIIPHDESAPGFRVAYLDGWWQVLDSTLYGTADQAERIKDLEGELKTAREKINRLRMDSSRELRLEAAALWSTNTMLQSDLARLRKAIEEAYDMLANRGLAGAIAAQQTLLRALTPSPAASGAAPGSADYDRGVECDPAPAAESASEMFRSLGQKMFARQYNDPPQALSEVIAERDQLRKRAEDAEANVMALVEQVRKLEGKAGVQDGPKTSD